MFREISTKATDAAGHLDLTAADIREIADMATTELGALSAAQLTWKPRSNSWSIAQVLNHLVTTNRSYFAPLHKALANARPAGDGNVQFRFSMLGAWFVRQVGPASKRKVPAMRRFRPLEQPDPAEVLRDFLDNQNELLGFIEQARSADLNRIRVGSPASSLLRFRLGGVFAILAEHEKRHMRQIRSLVDNPDFPLA